MFVAAINGSAAGFGLALVLACDFRISVGSARFAVAMRSIALTGCDMGISYLLPRAVGHQRAACLMYTGEFLTAPEALTAGMLMQVGEPQQLESTAADLVARLLKGSPLGLRLTKEGLTMATAASTLEQRSVSPVSCMPCTNG